jgi:hypothetical protein
LTGTKDRAQLVREIVEIIKASKEFIKVSEIIEQLDKENSAFIKSAVNLLIKNEILFADENSFEVAVIVSELNAERIESFIVETYSEVNETPNEVSEHFEQYGFEELVSSVSKQINHDNVVVKEFNFDRLMLGRYIDFLTKAESYISWMKADQATARAKMKKIKQQTKNQSK